MTEHELFATLEALRRMPHETEWLEFKEARRSFEFVELGKYFSALSNEANLKKQKCGWLVFGIVDKDRSICGSKYHEDPARLDKLKHEIAQHSAGITFRDIHVLNHPAGRVVMFEIPPAPQGLPTSFKGHWYGRDGESLGALNLSELEQIRSQVIVDDWSADVCQRATLRDIDPAALKQARYNFKQKNKNNSFAKDIDGWSDEVFLERARLTRDGKITYACLLLLGKPESVHHLDGGVAQLSWKLEGEERAYEHFGTPFLLTTNDLYARIRNTLQKIDLPGQLIPLEIPKYEKWVVLEAMHNAIAHQDYRLQSRVIVTEKNDRLIFENAGNFFEGQLDDYTLFDKTPQRYRNKCLADAMVNINMIDTMGYGIRRMFIEQQKRFYPLPDFNLSFPEKVIVIVYGKVIDPKYTALLSQQQDLPLGTVILLDQIQKKRHIDKESALALRRQKLVEGRFPNLYLAAHLAPTVDDKARYIKNRAFDDEHYKKLILNYLKKFRKASKKDIENLLYDKLSDVLDDAQKHSKIQNLLYAMAKRNKTIKSVGAGRRWHWELNLDTKEDV